MRYGFDGAVKSRRCSMCGIQFPPEVSSCLGCDGEVSPMFKTGPDYDWREMAAATRRQLGLPPHPSLGGDPEPEIAYTPKHPPGPNGTGIEIPLHIWEGRHWLSHNELIGGGYKHLEAGSIVFVHNRFYELQGYSNTRGLWWCEEIQVDGAAENLTPEMFLETDDG